MVEHLDGHTDIVHKQLYSDWLPWSDQIFGFNHYVLLDRGFCLIFTNSLYLQGNEKEGSFVAALLEKRR